MKFAVRHRCGDYSSYHAALVKSLYNVDSGTAFDLDANLPVEGFDWKLGLVLGSSGSGKSSLGREIFGPGRFYEPDGWPDDAPIEDAVGPASTESVSRQAHPPVTRHRTIAAQSTDNRPL